MRKRKKLRQKPSQRVKRYRKNPVRKRTLSRFFKVVPKKLQSLKSLSRFINKGRYRKNPDSSDHAAVRELENYIENDRLLYQNQARYIMVNLAKKMAKGAYDAKKAVKLWGYLAASGAQKYTKEFGGVHAHGSYGPFSPATRREVARELALSYDGETEELYVRLKKGERIKP